MNILEFYPFSISILGAHKIPQSDGEISVSISLDCI